MKIERINENKIRVILSFDDLIDREIALDSFNYNSPETQELFWDLMEQAEDELGFDAQESQLCIEAISDTEQGFIITVTRVDDEGEFESYHKYVKSRLRKRDLNVRRKVTSTISKTTIYAFDSLSDLCQACAHIRPLFAGASSAFKCDPAYYLVIDCSEVQSLEKQLSAILDEFGDRAQNGNFFAGYLNEYGTCLVNGHAVGALSQLTDA
jgi:adapter protein MecA 1/2